MKRSVLVKIIFGVTLVLATLMSGMLMVAHAEKMDIETHSVLIDKLQRVLDITPSNAAARMDLSLRLADLYSERARLEAMQADAATVTPDGKKVENKNPAGPATKDDDLKARDDRARAIALYREDLSKAAKTEKSRIVLQLAQLHELQGEPEKAEAVYRDVVKHKDIYDNETLGKSFAGIGEIYFRKMKYADAQKMFDQALGYSDNSRKPYINYRLAWCYFHRDNLVQARTLLTQALQSPDIQNDNSFREEASRDLATFLANGNVEKADIDLLSAVSPDNAKKENLTYFAQELDRLGKKSASVMVWNAIGQGERSPREQMESHLRMAELQYDAGKKPETFNELEIAIGLWKTNGCDAGEECTVLRQRIRQLISNWNRSEQENPTDLLFKAYNTYVSVFPDMEMNYRAALVARQVKQYDNAITLYRNAAVLALTALKNGIANKDDQAKFRKDFEASLLGEIEVAEMGKDTAVRQKAYGHYLELNPQGAKAFEVAYQSAHAAYEAGQYEGAAYAFKNIALSQAQGHDDLKNKAADLCLDSYVLAKKESAITETATTFAKAFPRRRAEFMKIANKGVMNDIAKTINDPAVSSSALQSTFDKLNNINPSEGSREDKIAYYKNKLILAEKLGNLKEASKAADGLLAQKGLSEGDREFALSRKAWVAEMTLNFGTAFSITKKLKMSGIREDERVLKLAMLAELSGHNPTDYYREYLSLTKDREKAALVAARLVRTSKNQSKALVAYEKFLKANTALWSSILLEVFAKTHDPALAAKIARNPALSNTGAGRAVARYQILKDLNGLERQLNSQHLDTRSDRGLKNSLKNRLALLQKEENAAKRAVQTEDWVIQTVALEDLAQQNRRLSAEVISLPAPRGLNRAQRTEYKNLLADRAREYQEKARTITAKADELWNQSAIIDGILNDYAISRGEVRKLIAGELKEVAARAPRERRAPFVTALATPPLSQAVFANINALKNSVRENPFDVGLIEKLKELEQKAGGDTMVAYLDARISKLQNPGDRR